MNNLNLTTCLVGFQILQTFQYVSIKIKFLDAENLKLTQKSEYCKNKVTKDPPPVLRPRNYQGKRKETNKNILSNIKKG